MSEQMTSVRLQGQCPMLRLPLDEIWSDVMAKKLLTDDECCCRIPSEDFQFCNTTDGYCLYTQQHEAKKILIVTMLWRTHQRYSWHSFFHVTRHILLRSW